MLKKEQHKKRCLEWSILGRWNWEIKTVIRRKPREVFIIWVLYRAVPFRGDEIKKLSIRQQKCRSWSTEALIRERLERDGVISRLLNYGSLSRFGGLRNRGFCQV